MSKDNLSLSLKDLSVDCSYVSSTWLRRPGLFGRAARLTLRRPPTPGPPLVAIVRRGLLDVAELQ